MKSNASTLLAQVENTTVTTLNDSPHCTLKLRATIAPHASKRITREAFRVNTYENRIWSRHVAKGERYMIETSGCFMEHTDVEIAVNRWQLCFTWYILTLNNICSH
jgi:hypothetical protein